MSKTLDTRDLDERLDELIDLDVAHEDAKYDLECAKEELDNYDLNREAETTDQVYLEKLQTELKKAQQKVEDTEMDSDDCEEFKALSDLKDEVGGEWSYGVQLIPEDDFEDYCQDMCEDIGDIPKDMPSYIVIDWDATCKNLKQDYSSVEYLGETYLYRAD